MLSALRVRQLAIVAELDLELGPGLQVVTGDTGAGKSILVDALQLVLGARARGDLVRDGADVAEVEALFDLTDAPEARAALAEVAGIEDHELLIRREIRRNGRSRAYLNGRMATTTQLTRIAGPLVDVCSQHEHHLLSDPATHLDLLDAFAGLDDDRGVMRSAWQAHRDAAQAVDDLARRLRERVAHEDLLRFQLHEIDAVDPRADEPELLEDEQRRLAHAEHLVHATRSAAIRLAEGDGALAAELARLVRGLEEVAGVDASVDRIAEDLAAAADTLSDAARELGRYARGVVVDPARLAAVDERLASLRRLARRHGGSHAALIEARERLRAELADLDDADGRLEHLEQARHAAADAAADAARRLSASRREHAAELGGAITRELHDLGMGDATVRVDVGRVPPRDDGLVVDGAAIGARGSDRVELLIAPNRGEPPRPLARIASGGELSRALLAIKRIVADRSPQALQVFDEVDTGVGGGVAEAIGRKLLDVARARQVLCITHHPQIAAYADVHVHVRKSDDGERTTSTARPLTEAERVEEIARMMGGLEIDQPMRDAARALLAGARRIRDAR